MPFSDPSKPERPPVWVSVLTCGQVLREADDVITAVRVSDSYRASPLQIPQPGKDGEPDWYMPVYLPINFHIVVMFNCEAEATFDVTFKTSRPDGSRFDEIPSFPNSHVAGGPRGLMLTINGQVPGNYQGVYWFDVYVDKELRARLPLLILHQSKEEYLRSVQPLQGVSPDL